MKYPTIEQVKEASHIQLCTWHRFLDSPGFEHAGKETFQEVADKEVAVMNLIFERLFGEFGGFTPEISKRIGW